MTVLKLGLTADLRNTGSVHTTTFKRAVQAFEQFLLPTSMLDVEIILRSDDACASSAVTTANAFLAHNVDAVIGHFASDAARAAAPIYQSEGIPLLLTASTDINITEKNSNILQLCANDAEQAKIMIDFLLNKAFSFIYICGDNSLQANHLRILLEEKAKEQGIICRESEEEADIVIYIGRFHPALDYLTKNNGEKPLLFSDDVFHPELIEAVKCVSSGVPTGSVPIYVCGFQSYKEEIQAQPLLQWYQVQFNELPATYFFETVAACDLFLQAYTSPQPIHKLSRKSLENTFWNTVMGEIHIVDGKNKNATFRIWQVDISTVDECSAPGTYFKLIY